MSLRNAIQCGRLWEPRSRYRWTNVPVNGGGVGHVFVLVVGL